MRREIILYFAHTPFICCKNVLKLNKDIYVVSIKGPIDQKCFSGLVNYSCVYEYTPNSIRTIIKQLKNQITLNGKLPK